MNARVQCKDCGRMKVVKLNMPQQSQIGYIVDAPCLYVNGCPTWNFRWQHHVILEKFPKGTLLVLEEGGLGDSQLDG